MKIVEKIVLPDSNLLAGKPISVTNFKNNEVLSYNASTKQWEADVITMPTLESQIDAATVKTPLVDTDTFPLTEPTTLKKTLWSTIKSTLKTYFDGLYLALTGGTLTGGLTITAATDAVNSSKITDKDGNVILSVDTVNNRVGINTSTPAYLLDIKKADASNMLAVRENGGRTNLILGNGSNVGWASIGGLDYNNNIQRLDISAGQVFINGLLYLQTDVGLTRTGDAASTATQRGSRTFNFEGSLWTGTAANRRQVGKLYVVASTTVDNLAWFVLGGEDPISPYTTRGVIYIKNTDGNVGINTSGCDKKLEINSADGNCLRLTYNDNNGSATYYADLLVSAAGLLTINASGGIINTANDIEITDATKGIILKSPDGSRFRVTVSDAGVLTTTEI